jgi:hypothetical protein
MSIVIKPATMIQADRIRTGQPIKKDYTAVIVDNPHGLPTLHLFGQWSNRKHDWLSRDMYEIEEIPAGRGFDGRAFLLHREPEAIARDAARDPNDQPAERYGTFIAADQFNHHCECRGHAARARCKHVDALLALIHHGHLEDVRAAAPAQLFPSPEQLLADAIARPF